MAQIQDCLSANPGSASWKGNLTLGSQESGPSCPLNWGRTNKSPKAHNPFFLKILMAKAGSQLRISSRWESQENEGPSHQQFYGPGYEQPSVLGLICVWPNSGHMGPLGFSENPHKKGCSLAEPEDSVTHKGRKRLVPRYPQHRRAR